LDRKTWLFCGHDESARRAADSADARRALKLTRAGYRIVRLEAELVMRDLPAALLALRRALSEA